MELSSMNVHSLPAGDQAVGCMKSRRSPRSASLTWSLLFCLAFLTPRLGEAIRSKAGDHSLLFFREWLRGRGRNRSSHAGDHDVSPVEPLSSGEIPQGVTKNLMVSWAQDPSQMGMEPGYPVSMTSCGFVAEAKLYNDNLPLDEHAVSDSFQRYVTAHQLWRQQLRDKMEGSLLYKHAQVLILQWNTELFFPTPWEILQSVIPTNGQKPNIDNLEGLFVTLQENTSKTKKQYGEFIANLVLGLNALSVKKNWKVESSGFVELNNWLGTKARAIGPFANTQTVILVARSAVPAASVTACRWSWKSREKGFVGLTGNFSGTGRLLVLGTHLPTLRENQRDFLRILLEKVIAKCVPASEQTHGLNYFTAGVLLTGDLNARLSEAGVYRALESVKNHPLYGDLNAVQAEELQTPEMAKVLYMLRRSLRTKEVLYFPLIWASDSLGAAPSDREENNLRSPLFDQGFEVVNACYTTLVSYGWQRGCKKSQKEGGESLFKRCLANKSRSKPTGLGFLDRLIIRPPVPRPCLVPPCPLPVADSFIIFSGDLQNVHSDHLPQVFVVELYRQLKPEGFTTESNPEVTSRHLHHQNLREM